MDEQRVVLERRLLADPFDADLRETYATLLLDLGCPEEAHAQYQILQRQEPANARAWQGAARALARIGRIDEARRQYLEARSKEGFVQDPGLELEVAPGEPVVQPRLRLLSGGRAPDTASENIVEITRTLRERVGFDDIAGLDDLKRTIRLQIVEPFLRPALFARFRKKAGGGVLLYGPPGCGKTMIARAIASECRAEFTSVGISDVLNMYIGESERNLAAIFDKARKQQPSVLFFDEIDALAFSRSKAHSEHTRQIVNEFLAQLDGLAGENSGLLVLAATNMPWDVDPAMKRPGRLSRQVFVPPPDAKARAHIIRLNLDGVPHSQVDAEAVAASTASFSGADIGGLVEEAKDYVLADHVSGMEDRVVTQADLLKAARIMRPTTLDWLRTATNLVKYAGADDSYRDVEAYLKAHKIK